ncbi:ComEC/Rec2 family competence protein [Corynebacterium atypicum]|uniref:ComEC/Rec2 family competence protein n=1 Tax=Corynebacterium atypicum TaxID=191610 RepID=UPI00068FD0C5|nr:ComEC/Rec2 family competence protein [Corynebacterium atypicum]
MSELRLVPAAAAAWLATLATLLGGRLWWGIAVAGAAVAVALSPPVRRVAQGYGQAIVAGAAGVVGATIAAIRLFFAAPEPSATVDGTLQTAAKVLDSGSVLIRVEVPGYPAAMPAFAREGVLSEEQLRELAAGAKVTLVADWRAAERAGVPQWVGTVRYVDVSAPGGFAGWVAQVRETLRASCQEYLGEGSQSLVPGMVLGDTSLQSPAEQQAYIDTGLTHLTAVSGSNVTIVVAAAFFLARAGAGPAGGGGVCRDRTRAVRRPGGVEPSVLRASVTGCVGLVAVVGSARIEPAHGLAVAVLGLVLWDSDLACQWGFALSVAATGGIIAVFPAIYRALARPWLPDALARVLGVAIAADVVTMPLIGGMAGRVSLVSVLANTLVAPAVAPVTVVGLAATVVALFPGGLETWLLAVIEPCTWWVATVAAVLGGAEHATVTADVLWVLVGYGWLL